MKSKMASIIISLLMVMNIFGAIAQNAGEPSSNPIMGLPVSNISPSIPQNVEQPSSSGSGSGGLADSPWPMFRQNHNHTGLSPYDTSGNPGKLKWSFTTDWTVRSSPAIGSDGTIYVGSYDSKLYAIYSDGTEKWNFTAGSGIGASPAIGFDDTIYIGSWDQKFYAINPDGTEKWNFMTGSAIDSSAAIGPDGTIYVGSHGNNLYAINPDGTEKWHFSTGSSVRSSPAISPDGTIYVGSLDYNLYAINPDGTEKWSFTTGWHIEASSPAIGLDGTIYVGSRDNKLYAINPDGSEKWNFVTDDEVESSPAIGSDGTIYIGSFDDKLYAINPDGTEKWNFKTSNHVFSSPAIGFDGTIYVGSQDNKLYAIKPDGTEKWNFTAGKYVQSSPAIGSDGTIYVGCHDYKLYAIGILGIPPIANAGPNQTVNEGDVVILDGSNSTGGTTGGVIPPSDLVSWWPGDGNASDIADGNHGTLIGGTTYDTGKVDQAFSFDGVNDRVGVGDSENLKITDSITIDAWLYIKSYAGPSKGHAQIIFRGDDRGGLDPYYLSVEQGGTIRFHVESLSNGVNLETPIPKDQFVFVATTLDDATNKMRIYIDGALAVETTTSIRPFKDLNPSYNPGIGIGNHAPSSIFNQPFHGLIDELEIFNRALTLSEIQSIFNAGIEGKNKGTSFETKIESYEWDFESDGIYDYQENPGSAPDGAFDGKTTHIYGDNGIFKVTLRVTDDTGLNDTGTCNITVNNVVPIVYALRKVTINEFESVTLSGHATDPGSDDLIFTWSWGYAPWGDKTTIYYNDGLGPDPFPSPTLNPRNITEDATCQFGDDGVFIVTLTVSDDDGDSTTVTTNVTINNIAPIATIESAIMDVEIGLRVAGRKYNNVSMTLYEEGNPIGYISIERMPGSPNDQMAWIPVILNMTKTYNATVIYTPEDPPNIGGNPVWIYIKFKNGTVEKIHHTFNVQQSKKRDSDHWNHIEPWEVDLNAHLIGQSFEITSHITDPGSDDETLTFTYGSQVVTITYLNNPPNPDPFPSPEVKPVDIIDTTTLTYEGLGTITLVVEDDDNLRLGIGQGSDSFDVV